MNSQLLDRPVGQLVAEKPARSRVFERWGIDYCCGGKKALADVCAKKNLDPAAVVSELELSDRSFTPPFIDWTSQTLTALCDHIQEVHHGYLRESLPRLTVMTEKVADRHGEKDPRLLTLKEVFAAFRSEMESHTAKEDTVLFPAIRNLENSANAQPTGRALEAPIQVMLADHDDAGEALEAMKNLTDGYIPSEDACNTHRAMLQALAELEADMHQHIHKENNILFPRTINF